MNQPPPRRPLSSQRRPAPPPPPSLDPPPPRRAPTAFQLMGVVPQGQALNADAERAASIVGGADFVPAPDGAINGNITNVKRADSALLVPVVRATTGDAAQAVNALVANGDAR